MVRVLFALIVLLLLSICLSGVQADPLDALEQAVARQPEDLTLQKQLALAYYEQGNLEGAIEQLERIASLAPGDDDATHNLMAAYRMQSLKLQSQAHYPEALQSADKMLTLAEATHLDAEPGHYQRIAVLCEQGDTDAAIQELAQMAAQAPLTADAQDLVVAALLRGAKVAAEQEAYPQALALIAQAARVEPEQYAHLHLQTVQILLGTGQSEKAQAVLEPLARTLPMDHPLYAYRLGTLYHQLGNIGAAMEALRRVPNASPYHERALQLLETETQLLALTRQAQEALAAGDMNTTAEHLREAIHVDPHQHHLHLNLTKALLQQGHRQEALAELERLSTFARVSQDAFYQFEMGQLYARLGETERSRHLLGRIPEASPRYEEAQELLAELAPSPLLHEAQEPPSQETSEQDETVAAMPSLQDVRTLMETGQQAEALSYLEQLLSRPDFRQDDRSRYEVGVLYLQLGDETQGHHYLSGVSESSLFHQAAQAFLTDPPTEQLSPAPLSVSPKSEEQEPATPMHPIERRIRELAAKHSIDVALAVALMKQESNFDPLAVSRVGAGGLCQIMPATGRDLGLRIPTYNNPKKPTVDPNKDERFHPYKSMDAGLRYLRQLLSRYDENVPLALSAYNAGMGRTKQRVARIYETTAYVADIMTHYWRYQDTDVLNADLARLIVKLEAAGAVG